jgi:hypothetical protein
MYQAFLGATRFDTLFSLKQKNKLFIEETLKAQRKEKRQFLTTDIHG